MNAAIIWLVRLGIDQGVFTTKNAWSARLKLGEDVDLVDFAQHLVDSGLVEVEKIEVLENLAGLAVAKSRQGPPADDPFSTSGTASEPPASEPPEKAAPKPEPLSARRIPPTEYTPSPFPSAAGSPTIQAFPFGRVHSMADGELAEALRGLLKACAHEGVSDLHLTAGAVPFLRRERELRPIGDQPLSAEDALRLNTILLAPHQRELFLENKDLDFALALDATNRYRVNLMFHKGGAAGAYRIVVARIPKLDDLGLRNLSSIRKLLTYHTA